MAESDRERPFIILHRLNLAIQRTKNKSAIVKGFGKRGTKRQDVVIACERFGVLLKRAQSLAAIIVRCRIIECERERPVETIESLALATKRA